MNTYLTVFFLISSGICSSLYCMEQQIPKSFRHLDWRADLCNLENNKANIPEKEYQEVQDQILEYAVDRYQQKKKCTFTTKQREKRKKRLLRNALLTK